MGAHTSNDSSTDGSAELLQKLTRDSHRDLLGCHTIHPTPGVQHLPPIQPSSLDSLRALEDQGLIQLEEIPAGDSGEITYRVSQP